MRKKLKNCISMLIFLVICVMGTACTTNNTREVVVIEKINEDGSSSIKIESGEMTEVFHPETYILIFEYEGQEGEIEVSKEKFESTEIGDIIEVPIK